MPEMPKHPYCCDAFALCTNEYDERPESVDYAIIQDGDGTWEYIDGCSPLERMIYCPFCGARIDRPGMERVQWRGKYLLHQDGSTVRWRDLADDGLYEVDDDGEIIRVGSKSPNAGPQFTKRPDLRPVFVDGVEVLLWNGRPAVIEDVLGQAFSLDPKTRIITPLNVSTADDRPVFYEEPEAEEPNDDKDDAVTIEPHCKAIYVPKDG